MGADELFEAVRKAHEGDSAVAVRQMFGSTGLKVGGRLFAMLAEDRLVVKLPEERVGELIASGAAVRFDPGHGRPMRKWAAVSASSAEDWLALASEARVFVASGR